MEMGGKMKYILTRIVSIIEVGYHMAKLFVTYPGNELPR
jgi:hypothetical protein